MKRKIFAVAAILGLIVVTGLSLQRSQLADTPGSATSLQTSKVQTGGELHSEEAADPHAKEETHSHAEEITDPHVEEEMDPDMPEMDHSNMPGMDHSEPSSIDSSVDRPLKETLGAFGVATSFVLSGALILKRRDKHQRELKEEARKTHGEIR